ncbi:pyridoxamine 5'-phosphate oxidase family protein [Gordonia sp. X0973]|uniref:pyridoxamine 5'-phosphate oxidase family protein n=1 Tax=Gordonia sp. X0973 TaxID=2742602 RepID=UPI000F5414FD|nr:pyridoxamine 5'-phosphate oxidase family protein [Gordonia sp. X0973]QKT08239.1 pyridoxamine 5'-phosphate oxidase family protein [Gordonia sp. X0973]
MELDEAAAQSFLARTQIGTIAIERKSGPPLALPIWYDYAPGGDVRIVTPAESFKARLLRAAGRCSLVVDTVEPRIIFVSVECELVDELPPSKDNNRLMASRYLPPEAVEGFVETMPAEALFSLRPTRWRTADLGQ